MDKVIINKTFLLENSKESLFLRKLIFFSLLDLNYEYPNFRKWLDKVFCEIITGNRSIILYLTSNRREIIAISILKHNEFQNKICTFRVSKNYRRRLYGTILMNDSLSYLDSSRPLITVSETHFYEFDKFLSKFDFRLYEKFDSYYKPYTMEYVYNEPLEKLENSNSIFYDSKYPIVDKAILCGENI